MRTLFRRVASAALELLACEFFRAPNESIRNVVLWNASVALGHAATSFALDAAGLGTGRSRVGAGRRARSSNGGVGTPRESRDESRVRPRVCGKAGSASASRGGWNRA